MKHNGSLMKTALLLASAAMLSGCGGANSESSSAAPGLCTVTFDLNGAPGSNKQKTLAAGDKITALTVNKDTQGYYFISWCTDQAGEHPYDFNQTVTSDITLYASWNFHVYFMDEVGDASAIATEYVTVRKDHKLDAVPECTNLSAGKRFAYWYRYADNDTEHLNPIQFNVDEAITEPELVYYAKTESYGRTFNFYIGEEKIKTSVADSDQEWVELPTYAETFGENEGFKGWYTDPADGERFDFVDFSVVKEDYQTANTDLYARYDTIEGNKPISDMVDAYKYKSYGAKVTEGIGTSAGTYSISLDEGCEGNESVKYGFALYPTIFYGNLYSKKYTLNLKLANFSTSGLMIQPRIFILDADGNRVQNGELYTKDNVMESAGSKNYSLYDLMAGGGSTYSWTEDHYFQLAFEFNQKASVVGMGSIQIESMNIFTATSSDIALDADYELDLSSIGESYVERCAASYDSSSKIARITNTVGKDDKDAGAFHYTFLKMNNLFTAKAGKTYKISGNIAKFSDKITANDRAVQFFICPKGGSNQFIEKTNATGSFEFDFTKYIGSDCEFYLALALVCTETWHDLDWGYFQNEYVEISSIKFLVS